ncbi:hypothetical protein [Demequina sp. NBRC 110055]|uniref:hypothetical protein n=1 Tax=Demequina sp. NBRC 110055 TaxID=1570344 RepID=UPI0013563298|nr:hypothetical protein [Demequina sp. NBRC 110055]
MSHKNNDADADGLKDKVVEQQDKRHDPDEQPVQTNPLGEEVPHGDGEPRETDGQDDPS